MELDLTKMFNKYELRHTAITAYISFTVCQRESLTKKKGSYPFLVFSLSSVLSHISQPSDDDTMSLHSQVSETARADPHILLTKLDSNKGVLSALVELAIGYLHCVFVFCFFV